MVIPFPRAFAFQQETLEHLKVIQVQRQGLECAGWKNAPGAKRWHRPNISKAWVQVLVLLPSGFVSFGKFFFFPPNNFILFIYFWLRWVFIAAHGLSLVAVRTLCCGMRASHCGGFSCCGARAPGTRTSVVVACGLSSCGLWALEHRLSSCGSWVQLLCSMQDLPGPELEPVSPALAGGFLTTVPPGKSHFGKFFNSSGAYYLHL